MKPINEYSFKDFKHMIRSANPTDHWYFSRGVYGGYYADYRPDYPDKTAADFTIYLGCDRVTLYQETATIPTVKQYSDMMDLLRDISEMELCRVASA